MYFHNLKYTNVFFILSCRWMEPYLKYCTFNLVLAAS